ncbi:MAG: alpha-L-fucosidase [Lachnospiraceae bacterium]|nr:alpha-L-fucosidase [Lachnospiraceae bacterium]
MKGTEKTMDTKDYLKLIDSVNENGVYKANWSSLSGHKTPEWYYTGKFGIFIHWGLYSVPAYLSEWYPRQMYNPSAKEYDYHIKTFGNHKDFGYKDFIPMFTADKFDAQNWAALFKKAGAKFVVPVCEHHDGFAMYGTEFNRWNSQNMGPKRNIALEIKEAVEANDMVFCASSHRAEHYFFMNMGRTIESDVNDEAYRDFYGPAYYCPELDGDTIHQTCGDTFSVAPTTEWLEDWLVRTCELIDKYQPKILYFDWWIHHQSFKPYLKKLCAYYYNRANEWNIDVTINYKHEAFLPSVATFDVERGALDGISPIPWQTDTAIGINSWGYTKDNKFKSARRIIEDLIDVVSKNGMLLLNIGPKPDGTITEEETTVLLNIGEWLSTNGEGIYGTNPWKIFGEGMANCSGGYFNEYQEMNYSINDFRFTYKNGFLYAFCLKPSGREYTIKSLCLKGDHDFLIENVSVLGKNTIIETKRTNVGLEIELEKDTTNQLPICFKVELS